MRASCLLAQAAALVLLVGFEVAFEPFDVAVAFEREDVRRQAVEEEAVVADDHGAAGEVLDRFFERAQASRRRDRWSARRAAARCRRVLSILAMWTRLRSPPESLPTFFCWSGPLKLNAPT